MGNRPRTRGPVEVDVASQHIALGKTLGGDGLAAAPPHGVSRLPASGCGVVGHDLGIMKFVPAADRAGRAPERIARESDFGVAERA